MKEVKKARQGLDYRIVKIMCSWYFKDVLT